MEQNKRTTKKTSSTKSTRYKKHICVQVRELERQGVLLDRISNVTLGNGNPQNGLLFMFREFLEDDKRRKDDINTIKEHLKGVNENYNILFTEIAQIGKELGQFKSLKDGEAIGKKSAGDQQKDDDEKKRLKEEADVMAKQLAMSKSRDNWYKVLTIIGLAAAIFFGVKNSHKSDKMIDTSIATEEKIDNLGVPLVTRNGKVLALPDSTQVIFFPYDSIRYTIKREVK